MIIYKGAYLTQLMFNLHLLDTSLNLSSAQNWMQRNMLSLCVSYDLYDKTMELHPPPPR